MPLRAAMQPRGADSITGDTGERVKRLKRLERAQWVVLDIQKKETEKENGKNCTFHSQDSGHGEAKTTAGILGRKHSVPLKGKLLLSLQHGSSCISLLVGWAHPFQRWSLKQGPNVVSSALDPRSHHLGQKERCSLNGPTATTPCILPSGIIHQTVNP